MPAWGCAWSTGQSLGAVLLLRKVLGGGATLSTLALENANTNTEVLKNMGYAAKAMKAAHDNMYVAPAGGGGAHTRKGSAGRARPQSQTPPLIHSGTQVCSNFHLFWNSSEMDYGAPLPLEADLME